LPIDPPEIEIQKEIVNSGEGYDAELVCEVHAMPKAKVRNTKGFLNKIIFNGSTVYSDSLCTEIISLKNTL
jgi:hypothetical protein